MTNIQYLESIEKLPNLDKFSKREINIPCGWWLTKSDRVKIIKLIKEV